MNYTYIRSTYCTLIPMGYRLSCNRISFHESPFDGAAVSPTADGIVIATNNSVPSEQRTLHLRFLRTLVTIDHSHQTT